MGTIFTILTVIGLITVLFTVIKGEVDTSNFKKDKDSIFQNLQKNRTNILLQDNIPNDWQERLFNTGYGGGNKHSLYNIHQRNFDYELKAHYIIDNDTAFGFWHGGEKLEHGPAAVMTSRYMTILFVYDNQSLRIKIGDKEGNSISSTMALENQIRYCFKNGAFFHKNKLDIYNELNSLNQMTTNKDEDYELFKQVSNFTSYDKKRELHLDEIFSIQDVINLERNKIMIRISPKYSSNIDNLKNIPDYYLLVIRDEINKCIVVKTKQPNFNISQFFMNLKQAITEDRKN
ncbi:MAG: hypothetical protein R2825_03345 [Saprospiraceae bacterium]